ncbi:hypothetical protein G6F56_002840 [Rhizopus delemar]|nr:hypothetical protein G6F56_002840 [Rhizopus delemar]
MSGLSLYLLAWDIKTCQDEGVKIILSLGGAAGSYGLSSDEQGQEFAQTIWDIFGGGSSSTRPFGDAIIDGIDLDIEGGPSTGYTAFVNALRSKWGSSFIVGAAPQCPFPDAILGSVINAVAMDYVNVQFYNNYCSVDSGSAFNFDTWDKWAKTQAPNKNIKVMLTVPGSSTAAGSGYAPISTLSSIIPSVASSYSSFGGVSVWDASQAWNNGGFNSQLYSLVHGSGSVPAAAETTTTTRASTTSASPSATDVTSDASCSNEGQMSCTSQGSYAVCDHGTWYTSSCPSGTVCTSTTDDQSIYCGYPLLRQASDVTSQFFATSSANKSFEAVIHARRTQGSFKKATTLEFKAPRSIRFERCHTGELQQVGRQVRVQVKNEESMGLVLNLNGTFSDILVAPTSFDFV